MAAFIPSAGSRRGQQGGLREGPRRQGPRPPATASTAPGSPTPTWSRSPWSPSTRSSATSRTRRTGCARTSTSRRPTSSRSTTLDARPTYPGLVNAVQVGIRYIEAWLRGLGAVAIFNLMEDAATAEISPLPDLAVDQRRCRVRERRARHARAGPQGRRRGTGEHPRRDRRGGLRGRPLAAGPRPAPGGLLRRGLRGLPDAARVRAAGRLTRPVRLTRLPAQPPHSNLSRASSPVSHSTGGGGPVPVPVTSQAT
ncbi:hypothetical protein STANM309S_05071 [Streptomyces tanashiensis]